MPNGGHGWLRKRGAHRLGHLALRKACTHVPLSQVLNDTVRLPAVLKNKFVENWKMHVHTYARKEQPTWMGRLLEGSFIRFATDTSFDDELRLAVLHWSGKECSWLPDAGVVQYSYFAVCTAAGDTCKVCFRCCMGGDSRFNMETGYLNSMQTYLGTSEGLKIVQSQENWCGECFKTPLFNLFDPHCMIYAKPTTFVFENMSFGVLPNEEALRRELASGGTEAAWHQDGWNIPMGQM